MSHAIDYFKRNLLFILLAFSLIAEAIVIIPFKEFIYYAGIIFLMFYAIKNCETSNKFGFYYCLFLFTCIISSCFALIIDLRLFAFVAMAVACTPITNSYRLYIFRERYLYHCLMIFPIVAVISIFCYFADINYFVSEKGIVNHLDFSALFPHPLWLGTALGLSNIVIVWLLFSVKNKFWITVLSAILLLSIYVSIVAASRSAFFSSVISMIILIIIKLNNLKKILIATAVISAVTVAFLPIYLTGAARMQEKFANSQGKFGSRTELVTNGLSSFKKSPLIGNGFAIGYNSEGEKIVGRMESGSGWLSILFQTGIAGFVIICTLLLKTRKVFPYIFNDYKLLLFFCSFLYLCLNSIFEGYLLTVGYYPCILFWTLLGFLHLYPYYKCVENYRG